MKKNYFHLFFVALVFNASTCFAQIFKLHAEYKSDWYGAGYTMNEDIPGYPSVTLLADSAADQFVIEADNGFNRWRKYGTTGFDTAFPTVWYTLGITDNYFAVPTQPGFYYTTRIKNLNYSSTNFIVMQTVNAPVAFATQNPVSQLPLFNGVNDLEPVVVTINLASIPSSQEKVFIRYSTNNFVSSSIETVLMNGTSGSATIPGLPAGTVVKYYAFTSTVDASQSTLANDYDLIALKQSTNQGANFSYTVAPVVTRITFTVNLSNEVVSPNGVYLAGSFNNFDSLATPMVDLGGGIFQVAVFLDTASTVYYKFLNGPTFLAEEIVPMQCGVANGFGGYNRYLEVPEADTDLDTVCFGRCLNCSPYGEVKVKFLVNMSQQIVSLDGIHVAGSFNNFNPSVDQLTDIGNGIYELALNLDSSAVISYKFINGNSFTGEEIVPALCGISNGFGGYNRILVVPEVDIELDTVCFSSCTTCINQVPVDIEFRVNLSQQTVSPNGLHLAGTFNGFDADSTEMISIGAGVYSATVSVLSGTSIEYKYINGNTFAGEEQVPSTCGVSNGFGGFNRSLTVPSTNTTLNTVCFSSCVDCVPPVFVPVTFRVNLSNQVVSADGVHLAGSFNGFDADSTNMTAVGGGVYQATVLLDTATTVSYKFINGNSFLGVENVPSACGVADGFGGYNRVMQVPNIQDTVNTVCFSACSNCVPPGFVDITFRVNMSNQFVSPFGVHIAGTFNGFDADSTALTFIGGGVYETVLSIDTTSTVLYKFINGDSFSGVESVPLACGVADGFGGYNRELIVPNFNTTLSTVCFSSCSNCLMFTNVSFRVNMSNQTVSPDGVHMAGSFNGFDADSTLMTPIGGGVYQAVVLLDTSAIVLYKFINGNTFSGVESVPAACGEADGFGGYNRVLAVPNTNMSVATANVCFSSCSDCSVPVYVDITFLVDMTGLTVSPNGVHIAGTFNGFDADSTAMTAIGNNLYSATVSLDTATVVQWKYINGNAFGAGADETVPMACGVSNGFGGYNRILDVPNSNASLGVVCFSSCTSCIGSAVESEDFLENNFKLLPNVTNENVRVVYSASSNHLLYMSIFTAEGRILQKMELPAGKGKASIVLNISDMRPGIYFVQLSSNENTQTQKLIVTK